MEFNGLTPSSKFNGLRPVQRVSAAVQRLKAENLKPLNLVIDPRVALTLVREP